MAGQGEFVFTGRTILITGGCKGIGLETAKRLSRGGARLILTTREDHLIIPGARKTEFLKRFERPNMLYIMKLNLCSIKSVFEFCESVRVNFSQLDCIICNAGVMEKDARRLTEDGWELHFGVNYLAHFYLVQLLLQSILLQSPDPRIILVSSKLLLRGSIDLTAVKQPAPCGNSSTVAQAYCDSKLCLALLARSLKLQHPGIRVFSVSPGWCRTNLGRKDGIPWITMPLLALPLLLFSVSASEGCDSIVFCAYTDRLPSGQFIRNREQEEEVELFLHSQERARKELWEFSNENLVQDSFIQQTAVL